ncbi:MAG: pyruvate kinase, partial [Euryarchaeota archaeon]|nr:pyruvate kinase [Marinobacter sp.]
MLRRTKIVATLGPATDAPEALAAIIRAGVDVVRLNFSHGSAEEHIERARRVREAAAAQGRFVALLADLQGPKLRIARFANNKVTLTAGQRFVLDAAMDKEAGTEERVGIDYEQLINDVRPGDILVLDDGRIEMRVDSVDDHSITSTVLIGGPLSNNKGLNKRGGGLSAEALTDKDRQDIVTAARLGADYVAVSFVRTADDLHTARRLLGEAGSEAGLVAKIERAELAHDDDALDAVILASDAVMVARGDLAVEIGDAELVGVQKHIISRARSLNRGVITATQMMESMITNPMPTRAEVSDVANAVMDYTDAVMLSAETAVGDYPREAVEAMVRICLGAEKHPSMHQSKHRIHESMGRVDEAIALSAMYAANHLQGVAAIICMTETGATPRLMSRIKSSLPIFAFSRHHSTQHRMALFRGVQTVPFDTVQIPNEQTNARAVQELVHRGV